MDEWVILSDGESDTAAAVLDGGDDTASDDSDTAASDLYNGSLSGYTARSRPLVSHFGGVDGAPPPLIYEPLRAVMAAAAPPLPPEFVKEVSYSYGEALSIGGGDEIKQRPAASEIEAITQRSKLAIDAASQEDTICEIGNAGVVICDGDVVELTADVDDGGATTDGASVVEVTDAVGDAATAQVVDGGATTDDVPVVEVADVVDQTATVHVDDDGATIDDVSVVEVADVVAPTAHVGEGGPAADGISVVDVTDVVEHTATVQFDDGGANTDDVAVVEVTDVVDHTAQVFVDPAADVISVVDVTDVVDHTAASHVDDGGGAAADGISVAEVPPLTVSAAAPPPPTSSEVGDEHESRSPPTPAVVAAPRATDPPPPRFSPAVDDEHERKSIDAPPTPPAASLVSPAATSPPPPDARTSGEVGKSVVDDEPVHVLTTAAAAMKATASDSGGEDTADGGSESSDDPLEHCGDCHPRRLVIREKEETSTEVLNLRQELAMLHREAAVAVGRSEGYAGLWLQSPAAINAAYEACKHAEAAAINAANETRKRAEALLATINAVTPEAPTAQAPPADRRHGSVESPADAISAALEARTQAPPATTNAAAEAATINAATPEARTKVSTERRRGGSEPSAADMADFAIAYLFSSSCMILYSFLLASYFY
uniref:Uncharacterized protein n=1 Tax=Oryza punctata TaxID=4537 RepID=A0A0E0KJM7_ORYPU